MKISVQGFSSTFLLLITVLLIGCSSDNQQQGGTTQPLEQLDASSAQLYPAQREAKARDFEVTLINDETFKLSDYEGHVVLLNIWATWCAPCREETPDLQELYEEYQDEGLVILGVSVDEQGESVVRPFIEEYDVSYPIVIDKNDVIMDKYGPTMGIPTTYIINKKGDLEYFAVGAVTNKELEPRIQTLLEE
ncbi:MAG: TlpA disulfide reductase family protein [Bacteroidota bacterium]